MFLIYPILLQWMQVIICWLNLSTLISPTALVVLTSSDLNLSSCPQLEYVNIKDGMNYTILTVDDCPLLKYVCLDEYEILNSTNGNFEVNSDCIAGENWNTRTIEGRCLFNASIEACDGNSEGLAGQEISLSNNSESVIVITDDDGSH